MKKYLLSAVILLAALTVQAQKSVKITPTLKVGMQKTYITRGEATTSGSAAADITGELVYKVDGKTANGYQISMVSKSTNIDANQVMQSLTTPDLMQMLNSIRVELLTDKKGAVTAIGNTEEVLGKCMAVMDSMFNATIAKNAELKNNPEAAATMQKSMGIMKEMFTENYLLESYAQTPGITMLNGKTITDGMVEEGTFSPFFKTRTTYSLQNDGKTIVQVTEGDIDMESLKTYMSRMLSAMLPESVTKEADPEQLTSVIDNMISNGSMKMDMKRTATYDIASDGWVKKMVMEMSMNMPGQCTKGRQEVVLKE
ncbi:MAG: hypothetical protein IJM04_03020 [Prevotella sp.]|nr:hypothetical protein [Prevotella sp.]